MAPGGAEPMKCSNVSSGTYLKGLARSGQKRQRFQTHPDVKAAGITGAGER